MHIESNVEKLGISDVTNTDTLEFIVFQLFRLELLQFDNDNNLFSLFFPPSQEMSLCLEKSLKAIRVLNMCGI